MVSNAPSGFSPIAILPDNIKVEKTDQLILAGWGLTADAEEIPVLRSTETQINKHCLQAQVRSQLSHPKVLAAVTEILVDQLIAFTKVAYF